MPPNPADPSFPPAQPSNQPTIRSFLRRSVRKSVASAMDIDLTSQESRKRDREDNENDDNLSIYGSDIVEPALSDSLINNTSLLPETQGARRRRISSADVQSPEGSSTPNPIILQMREIRQAITSEEIEDPTVHPDQPLDSSTVAAAAAVNSMVDGVIALAGRVVPERNQLTWDNAGLPGHPSPPPSPLPTPFPPTQSSSGMVRSENDISDIMALVRTKMEECTAGLHQILTEKMAGIDNMARTNAQNIEAVRTEIKDVASNSAENTARIDQTRAEIRDIESAIIPELDERVRQQEIRIVEAVNTLDENNDAVFDALNHVNRIEARVAQISATQEHNIPIQSILQRIEALENQNREQREAITILEDERQKAMDNETMRTVLIRGFRVPSGRPGTRSKARSVLSSIGCEDVLVSAQKVRFSANDRILKLTFATTASTNEATVWFSQALRQIKGSGQHTDISFSIETPHRFATQRRVLNEIGFRMKSRREITRYDYVILRGQLWLRTYTPGHTSNLIPCPPDTSEPMDTDAQQSPSVPTCPICMGEYDQLAKQAVFHCGHRFHLSCLSTALSASTSCPVCRMSPNYTESIRADCDTCRTFTQIDQERDAPPTWSLSAKCGHLHHTRCAEKYLTDRGAPFPPGPDEIDIIQANPDMKGCTTCQQGILNNPDAYSRILYEIAPSLDLPDYINLGMNGPGHLPRRWPETVVELSQLLGTGTRSRRPPNRSRPQNPRSPRRSPDRNRSRSSRPHLSGANTSPLGERRPRPPTGESLLMRPGQPQDRDRRDRSSDRRRRNDTNRTSRAR